MADPSDELIGQFVDAVVEDPPRAETLLAAHPGLLNARWTWGATVLHFCVVEGFTGAVKFLAQHSADVNAVNKFGDGWVAANCGCGRAASDWTRRVSV